MSKIVLWRFDFGEVNFAESIVAVYAPTDVELLLSVLIGFSGLKELAGFGFRQS